MINRLNKRNRGTSYPPPPPSIFPRTVHAHAFGTIFSLSTCKGSSVRPAGRERARIAHTTNSPTEYTQRAQGRSVGVGYGSQRPVGQVRRPARGERQHF